MKVHVPCVKRLIRLFDVVVQKDSARKIESGLPDKMIAAPPDRTVKISPQDTALYLPGLRRPSLQDYLQHLKSMPSHTIDFGKAEAVLRGFGGDVLAQVWLGILNRVTYRDPRPFLEPLVDHPIHGRLALLNLCAFYAGGRIFEKAEKEVYLTKVTEYMQSNPEDKFARLLQALLFDAVHKRTRAHEAIESLYLDEPTYVAAKSLMASFLYHDGYLDSSYDYAREVLQICPKNVQAVAVSRTEFDVLVKPDIYLQIRHVGSARTGTEPETVLYMQYNFIDL